MKSRHIVFDSLDFKMKGYYSEFISFKSVRNQYA